MLLLALIAELAAQVPPAPESQEGVAVSPTASMRIGEVLPSSWPAGPIWTVRGGVELGSEEWVTFAPGVEVTFGRLPLDGAELPRTRFTFAGADLRLGIAPRKPVSAYVGLRAGVSFQDTEFREIGFGLNRTRRVTRPQFAGGVVAGVELAVATHLALGVCAELRLSDWELPGDDRSADRYESAEPALSATIRYRF